ncbi:hypothetical protein HOLleu_07357 [Holothuria leucospilota]|uniref:LTD domain-containing protein n=1 Tax=Holothuria leucospilota TaxID=206669 RepID=A0A9Q1CH76_HOLLE|nr:hypothetical protein HOLleu_07357 [Holothuria leucospilota]
MDYSQRHLLHAVTVMVLIPFCTSWLSVNEVYLRVEGSTGSLGQFVELKCYGRCDMRREAYKLLFVDSESVYKVIDLSQDRTMSSFELLLVGPANVNPDIDWGNFTIHLDSPSCVAVYNDEENLVMTGHMPPYRGANSLLMFSMHNPVSMVPINLLYVFYPKTNYYRYVVPVVDKSLSRCGWRSVISLPPTPKSLNRCPSQSEDAVEVIINELNAASPRGDRFEFVELLNIAHVPVNLGNYTLVLYDGRNNTAYKVIPLMNATLAVGGLYVIGSSRLTPHPQQIFEEGSLRTLQNGADAVALYRGNQSHYQVNMTVTNVGLVDALVYDSRGRHSEMLTAVLTPGEMTLHENWRELPVDESLSRCNGTDPRAPSQFILARRSHGRPNHCTPRTSGSVLPTSMPGLGVSPLMINEFSLEASNQYIELYDGGIGNFALDGLLIAFYISRTMRAYTDTVVLNGYKTDINGYFLIKAGDTSSDTEISFSYLSTIDLCAIALYKENANNIVRGSLVSSENLVDVVLYGTPVATNRRRDLVDALLPGATPLGMDEIMLASKSYSRCRGWSSMQMSSFKITNQSPAIQNTCPLPQVVINEVDLLTATVESRFVELYSDSPSDFSLDGVVLLIFQRQMLIPLEYFSLDGFSINDQGVFTIGHENGTHVDYAVDIDWTSEIGAVALYLGSARRFEYSKEAVNEAIVDALVLSNSRADPDLDLMNTLTPHQSQVNDLDNSTSISRCRCCTKRRSDSFGNGPPSPGSVNEMCHIGDDTMTESLPYHQQLLRINEVYTTPGGNGLFIELYDAGYSRVRMEELSLSLFSASPSTGSGVYAVYGLQKEGSLGETDENGFYTVGTASSGVALNVEVHESERFVRGTTNAIVLWKNDVTESGFTEIAADIMRDKIIDVIVFGADDSFDYRFLQTFTSFQPNITVNSTFMTGAFSISRCHSRESGDQLAFDFSTPTPGAANNCPMPPLVINEFNVMVYGHDMGEFIEISSLGIPNFPLNNIIVVLYSRDGTSYQRYAVNDRRTDHNGFFVLGYRQVKYPAPDMPVFPANGNFIRNGPDAVALHRGKTTEYPVGREVTNENLIDAVVYGVWGDRVAQNLIDVLTPGKEQVFEVTSVSEMDESISRCIEGGKVIYRSVHISPKFPNFCPYNDVKFVISEVNLEAQNQFIEIWDFGMGLMSLDNVSIVLFDSLGLNYMEIPLNDYRTEAVGYFVLGTSSVTPRSQFITTFSPGFIRTSGGAVALYKGEMSSERRRIQSEGLMDAVVYSDGVETLANSLIQTFSPNTQPIPSLLLQEEGSSVSRCFSNNQTTSDAFAIRPPTPLGLNDCPIFETDIKINEINIDKIYNNPNSADFIELYDGGRGNTSLDYLTLVLFDGGYHDRSYMTVGLHGYRTNSDGFFVIGASTSMEDPDFTLPETGFLHQGPDGIAIYRAPTMAFTYGTMAVGESIVDGIVYSLFDEASLSLESTLTPGYATFHLSIDDDSDGKSISRCYGNHRRNPTKFGVATPSPGKPNSCSSASAGFTSVVINEINIDPDNVRKEFIELYDMGVGRTPLDGFSLVFFDGANQDRSYYEVDLNGQRTDANGFFTIGRGYPSFTPNKVVNHNFIQNGPDAVVLYKKPVSSFPRASVATADGMVDVLIYGKNDDTKTTLIDKLTPGQIQINEQQLHIDGDESLSRCLSNDTLNLAAFVTSYPTPGAANNCTLFPIYINEINFDSSKREKSDFIELYDGGRGFTSLDSLVLVLFSEFSRSVFSTLPLQNNYTDINGFFTIGGADVQTDLQIDSDALWGLLAKYPGAVGLYRGDHRDFQLGMAPSTTNLIDAVILGSEGNPATVVGAGLLPGQPQILEEKFYMEGDESICRCKCCNALRMADFALGPSSLQEPNSCDQMGRLALDQPISDSQFIVINEVKMSGNDEGQLPMEVELYGSPGMNLDRYVLVYYSILQGDTKGYFIISLSGTQTDNKGYYTLTKERAADLESLEKYPMKTSVTVGAVGLYDRIQGSYSYGMVVTDRGLIDAVTFTDGSRDVSALQMILNPLTKPVMSSVKSENYLQKYKQLSLSRCRCCDIRNNSVFTLTSLTSGQSNLCPNEELGTTIQLRLTNADYSQWRSNDAWRTYLKEKLADGVESICQCGFSVAYLADERILEGSVVYEALLMGIDEEQSKLILKALKDFVKRNATITIMDQIFMVDDCTENCLSGERGRRVGGKGGVAAAVIGVLFVMILVVVLAVLGWLYRNHIHMLYLKTIEARGSSDGEQFNNNRNVSSETNIDDGIVNPVYEGNSQSGVVTLAPQFEDPAANPSGEQPYLVSC